VPTKRLAVVVRRALAAVAALSATTALAQAQSAADFFKKTPKITMYIGSGAGGGYDEIARFVAPYLSKYLPYHPTIVPENMGTAGGLAAANFLYNSAPRDGSAFLASTNAALALPLYDSPVAHFDPSKFEWIGSTGKQQAICVTWKTSGIATLDQAKTHVVTVSSTAINQGPGVYPTILNAMLGTKFKVIPGYSTGGMRLAVEQGEVEGLCGYAWQSYQAIGSKWFVDKQANILAQFGLEKNPDLPDVPLVDDLVKNPIDKQVLDLIVAPQEFGRPFVAPPGVPADRMAVYRQAFAEVVKDPDFLAKAKALRMVIEPMYADQIENLLARAAAAPKAIRDRAAVFAAQM
jgi:tripartite-type tricarboxylate transporter receptor subunit TctC